MILDYENCSFFEKLGLIGESYLSNEISEIAEQINASNYDIEVFKAYIGCVGKADFQSIYEGVISCYIGEYSDGETYVQFLRRMWRYIRNLPSYICIDWESTARNLMFDYFESGGYYFRT